MNRTVATRTTLAALVALGSLALAACDGDGDDDDGASGEPVTLTMIVYDSFPIEGTPLNDALAEFTADTGIGVTLAVGGDAGTMVTKAVLTSGNPEGDVMYGVDNAFLSAALDADVFEPYTAADLDAIRPELTSIVPDGQATPVNSGDVCINYDIAGLADAGLEPPTSIADLARPEYASRLVVQDPSTSSPGLAFLLATVATFGEGSPRDGTGWQGYWAEMRRGGVTVVDSWTTAYYESFSGSAGSTGDRQLVVSYGSSPPAEVLFASSPIDEPPTAVVESTCFRQVEVAGILRGTDHRDEAERLVDFLIGDRFQRELPLTQFVNPARADTAIPDVYAQFTVVADDPLTVDPADIDANRTRWLDEWAQIVLRG